jgi:hypothetical protein
MHRNWRSATFVIDCPTPEKRQQAEQLARADINLRNDLTSVVRSFPGGTEERTTAHHRLSDYFEDIRIEQQAGDSAAFRLVFNPRENADKYWKDLMARILRSVSDAVAGVSVKPLRPT